jgi:hypothetical protein
MKQFYEINGDKGKFSPLVREISWTNNLTIISRAKAMKRGSFICYFAPKTTIPSVNRKGRLAAGFLNGR